MPVEVNANSSNQRKVMQVGAKHDKFDMHFSLSLSLVTKAHFRVFGKT